MVCGLSGYAIAQSAGSAAPVKTCAKKSGGALRVARKCKASERRVLLAKPTTSASGPQGSAGVTGAPGHDGATGPQGPAGTNGTNGTNGTDGTSGTNGTTTGETFFATAGAGSNFGTGPCVTTPSGGPSITFDAPTGAYVQVGASVSMQRSGGSSNAVCLYVDGANVSSTGLVSTSLAVETRYLNRNDTGGVTDRFVAEPLVFPVSAGSHTISLRYTSNGGAAQFTNRNLYVTVLHPTTG
jgi:hypothetical protein